jgi:hypothetical protein
LLERRLTQVEAARRGWDWARVKWDGCAWPTSDTGASIVALPRYLLNAMVPAALEPIIPELTLGASVSVFPFTQ